ncbi:fatty acid desaturase family protein [Actinomadura macrotermitis]|uniref:NADPH-dependent stearoyl-CoA 9-desaturase n=1 Tax=Actinomadura macrotermitis TaxID=2585200 RepID=A0A7K0BXJ7_9ACTN|nr:acyl-CoA desaturase [Actinomadura macrotermitis]MQY05903.1 NADPH-dependent stearoyl-CoA 9-desaturase [Actinomadura macrotermitis]
MTNTAAHLTPADYEAIGAELDALRDEITADLGERDADYIHKIIKLQRGLEITGRALLMASALPPAWLAGTATLSVAKILENMEIGHNVMHGQWDWMRDPKIHSTTWEWDNVSPAEQWKHSHNFVHHTFTNIVGKDNDVGYGILRVTPEQPWHPANIGQPVYNLLLAMFFEYGVALHDLELEKIRAGTNDPAETKAKLRAIGRKIARQWGKDYLAFPLLSGPQFGTTLAANFTANIVRNLWSNAIIFCGHFPGDVEVFELEEEQMPNETRGEWYVRQLLGSANISGNKLFHLMSGNLSHQIEHHLFPDMPSNRLSEIAPRVRALCEKYDLPYHTGPFSKQITSTWKKIFRYALPGPKVTEPSPMPRAREAKPVAA